MTLVEGTRTRTIRWTDPARTRFQLRNRDGYERLAAIKRCEVAPPPAAALLGMSLDELDGRTVFSVVADEPSRTHGTMQAASSRHSSTRRWAALSSLPADAPSRHWSSAPSSSAAITAATGRVCAEGKVVHSGGRVATTARRHDDAGVLCARPRRA